jgi:hypothetical protein
VSSLSGNGRAGYLIGNLGRSNVRVTWNIPINLSLKVVELAFAGPGVLLAPGAFYRKMVDPASQPAGKGVTGVERPSQVLVEVGGRPIILVNLTEITPHNGEYETTPNEFAQREALH